MKRSNPLTVILPAFVLISGTATLLHAQGISSATLSATVTDPSGASVGDARVAVTETNTNLTRTASTSSSGVVQIPFLPPGNYSVAVQHPGFKPLRVPKVILEAGDEVSLPLVLELGQVSDSVTVVDSSIRLSETASVGTVVDRQFAENLPLNGRTIQPLLSLSPGFVFATKAANFDTGDFSVNGQRPSSNYFTIDGASANFQANATTTATGPGTSGQAPAYNLFGGTNSIVAADAVLEVRIQTSTFAPEFGRTPGAQVSVTTRSGTNHWHGTLFEYFRNNVLDANDWFANSRNLPHPPLRQNQFGGVLGAPIIHNRTFGFFSYEGLRLRQPQVAVVSVPSLASRAAAPPAVRAFLNDYPQPTGGPLGNNGYSEYATSYAIPTTMDSLSARIDHSFSDTIRLFGRYSHAPTNSSPRSGGDLAVFNPFDQSFDSGTLGLTWIESPRILHDFRFNYSSVEARRFNEQSTISGSAPVPDSLWSNLAFPADYQNFTFTPSDGAGSLIIGGGNISRQHQANVVETSSLTFGSHQIKAGIDYRSLVPDLIRQQYAPSVRATIAQFISNTGLTATIDARDPLTLAFSNVSAFAQDTWKVGPRLTLTYGVRYEVNPAPQSLSAQKLPPITSITNPSVGRPGDRLFATTWANFAPRLGFAYLLRSTPQWSTALRGGVGIFYDFGYGMLTQSENVSPVRRDISYANLSYPLNPAQLPPAPYSLTGPFADFFAVDPNLKLPYVPEYNLTVEQSLGASQTFTVAYVGDIGRRLLRTEQLSAPNAQFTAIRIARNTATSDYNSLQLQFRRRLTHGLQALASYTWSKALDTTYVDNWISASVLPFGVSSAANERGPADFDVRHSVSAALSYQTSSASGGRLVKGLLNGWGVDTILSARTALPVDVTFNGQQGTVFYAIRPNLISGVPTRVDDPNAPGGWRLNKAAFSVFTAIHQGSLGRNSIRGFPESQIDLALRRTFPISERLKLQFRGELFNVLNHPNFANPGATVTSATFGLSSQMLAGGLGGVSSLYSIGGPRSVQLALKLIF
jgi:Carboxypeptidase regulatory-like domain/TonB dependent receptor